MDRILLIEDNPLLAGMWKTQLRKSHFEVSSAANGYDGINKALLEKPRLILVDSIMPELDGYGFIDLARRTPQTVDIPIIMMSNSALSTDIGRAREMGAADYLLKYELTPVELVGKISTLLGRQGPSTPPIVEDPLGRMLIDAGYLSAATVERAVREAVRGKRSLAETIIALDMLEPPEKYYLGEMVARADFVRLADYTISPLALALVPEQAAIQWDILPIRITDSRLVVAMADPGDVNALDFLRQLVGREVYPVYATHEDIEQSIILYYGSSSPSREILQNLVREHHTPAGEDTRTFSDASRIIQDQAPVVELVDVLIVRALEARASDIHLEPSDDSMVARFRIDGILHDIQVLPQELGPAISTRVKVMGGMNIAERRLPQDGRFQIQTGGEKVDFRVSSVPTVYGEKIVLRILTHQGGLTDLEHLGFTPGELDEYCEMVERPYGMVILTGPTGSGKTTTLYSTLNFLKSREINIISIEDPVEYKIPGINQIQVNSKIDLTFANVLRSVLRQDPNVILVGEIRDDETALLGVQAALTGHLVLTTLHTNNAPGAFLRLVDLGLPAFLVASAVNGVVAQRLMRTVCPDCADVHQPDDEEKARLGSRLAADITFRKGRGCARCRFTGYHGRSAIFEILPEHAEIRRAIMAAADSDRLREVAIKQGMKTLQDSAWEKVRAGISTLDEMWRVTV